MIHEKLQFLTTTRVITENNINSLTERFFPSLFQKNIEKKYEIRTFILGEESFSMAIFSQLDIQTQEDFRNYNNNRPNRNVPYTLPEELEKSIFRLMRKLGLQSGSIDLIKSSMDNQYYFLEVNPVGQFGMVSKPCNYFLEKKVAEYLIKLQTNK